MCKTSFKSLFVGVSKNALFNEFGFIMTISFNIFKCHKKPEYIFLYLYMKRNTGFLQVKCILATLANKYWGQNILDMSKV